MAEADVDGKIFLGGLTWQTTDDMLKAHFGKWGTLNDVILMRNKMTGEPRGFGFVQFTDTAGEVPCRLHLPALALSVFRSLDSPHTGPVCHVKSKLCHGSCFFAD